jgi:predicted nuclease of restriction endonuclease-like (RecB) superfamily
MWSFWGRCATDAEREFCLRHALRENHSVRDLRRAIDTSTFERVALADGKIATLSRVFPEESRRHFKYSYVVEFLGLPVAHSETDLRRALVHRLGQFLRELGRDFSFIGKEYPIQVGTHDGSIDLLCKTKDDEVVEYALRRITLPALVAEYRLQLPDKKLPQAKLHEFFEQEAPQD